MDDLTPDADPDQEEEEDSDPELRELEGKNKCQLQMRLRMQCNECSKNPSLRMQKDRQSDFLNPWLLSCWTYNVGSNKFILSYECQSLQCQPKNFQNRLH